MAVPVIHTIHIDIEFPLESPRFILVQPKVNETDVQGYVLTADSVTAQLTVFQNALKRMKAHEAHFLLLPEYSLPAAELEQLHKAVLDDLPNSGVVVAGLDAMTYPQYAALVAGQVSAPDAETIEKHGLKWVNAAVVWVRGKDGKVTRFMQPKIFPAEPEQKVGAMYEGGHIFRFQSGKFSFALLICRDLLWDVKFGGQQAGPSRQPIGQWLADQWRGSPVDVLFWVQYNDKPEAGSGLDAVEDLLTGEAARCVVAANHAKYGKSAFYFPTGSYAVKPGATQFPRDYAFQKVPERKLHRARFRNSEPSVLLFTYRPIPYNSSEEGLIPITPEGHWQVTETGEFVGGSPVDALAWAYRVAGKEFHPSKKAYRPNGALRYRTPAVYDTQVTNFSEVTSKLQLAGEQARREITRTLFLGEIGEPVEWTEDHRDQVGAMMNTLAALHFTGRVHLPGGEKPAVARLDLPPRFVAVVSGDRFELLRACGEMAASELEKLHTCTLPGPISIFVLEHTGDGVRVPIRHMVENKLLRHAAQFRKIDAAPVPPGEEPVENQQRIDNTDAAGLTAHSYSHLQGILLESDGVASAADAIKKEVTP